MQFLWPITGEVSSKGGAVSAMKVFPMFDGSKFAAGRWRLLAVACIWVLAGCDQLGIETPQKAAERAESDAKAVGGACRHALRAIEDCYTLNPKADKAAVYTGWREMDEYMRENKLDGIAPVVPRPAPAASAAKKPSAPEEDATDEEHAADEEAPPKKKAKSGH